MKTPLIAIACLALAACATAPDPQAPKVKVTPLGSHDGEFCPLDRALVFEDPDGTRILYDAGRTVRGPNDPRLGRIDAVLVSHVHGDHLGDLIQPSANAGACPKPDFSVNVTPNSNSVNIVLGKQAPLIVGGEMHSFFQAKVQSLGGDPNKLVRLVRFGAQTMVGKVMVASVPAVHSNGLPPAFLPAEQAKMFAGGLTAYVGPPGGFVLRFSNGLTAYLSGDTGITAEQDLVVRGHYKANLVVMNIGGFPFTTGPDRGGLRGERPGASGLGHRLARQRAGDRGRQALARPAAPPRSRRRRRCRCTCRSAAGPWSSTAAVAAPSGC